MGRLIKLLPALGLAACAGLAQAVSDAPLQALNAYIEHAGNCSDQVVEWNRRYNPKTRAGETSRGFYYRALGNQEWGACGRRFFRPLLIELQKVWEIRLKGEVSEAEFEAKEAQLIDLFFAALDAGPRGEDLVRDYEADTAARLYDLVPSRQYFNCSFFGRWARCLD